VANIGGRSSADEFKLCEQFGASRFTVCEAIKQLVQLGLVDRQRGVGTRVKIAQPSSEYRQVMQRLADLRQYSAQTELGGFHAKTIELDKELVTVEIRRMEDIALPDSRRLRFARICSSRSAPKSTQRVRINNLALDAMREV
jgi:DNA-binding GntR family transcriptional regulator